MTLSMFTREKEELELALRQLQGILDLMRQKEDTAMEKLKKAVHINDKAQLEQENVSVFLFITYLF